MEKATERPEGGAPDEDGASKRRRGPGVFKLKIDRRVTLTIEAPAGSRHKGYEEIIVQDLMLKAGTMLYRRERWETPEGKRLIAPLDGGIVGGCGPHLHRLVRMLHVQGQMSCERIVELSTGLGLAISKRQVARLLTAKLERFRAEDEAVLRAGLAGAPFVTVDDTGARHAGKTCFITRIGSDRFTAFRTGPGKSRLAFLSRLLGGAARYVINAAAIAYMRGADLPQDVIDQLAGHASLIFPSRQEWRDHLRALGLADLKRGYDHHAIAECCDPEVAEQFTPMIHLVFSNLKTWLNGVSAKHLQAYLNEFTFRFNRRFYPFNAFRSLLGIAGGVEAPTYADLYSSAWTHPTCSGCLH
jgi:ISXO2-like transposase domain